jgi:Rhodanese-like domain
MAPTGFSRAITSLALWRCDARSVVFHVLQFAIEFRQNPIGMIGPLAEIDPHEVQHMLLHRDEFLLVDVREPWEHDAARIKGSILIPLRDIPSHVSRLAGSSLIVAGKRVVLEFDERGIKTL